MKKLPPCLAERNRVLRWQGLALVVFGVVMLVAVDITMVPVLQIVAIAVGVLLLLVAAFRRSHE